MESLQELAQMLLTDFKKYRKKMMLIKFFMFVGNGVLYVILFWLGGAIL